MPTTKIMTNKSRVTSLAETNFKLFNIFIYERTSLSNINTMKNFQFKCDSTLNKPTIFIENNNLAQRSD